MDTHVLFLRSLIIWLLITGCSWEVLAQSKTLPESQFNTGAAVADKIVVEDQYFFTLRRYSPPVEIKPVTRENASYDTPEAATISAISSMILGDYQWFRSTWDSASIVLMDQRDKALNQNAQFWTNTWAKAFKDKKVELTARIETGDYVLIAYRLVGSNQNPAPSINSSEGVELVTVLKLRDGKWLATQELSQDPVLLYWKTPTVKPKRIVRAAGQLQLDR